jgi:predicted extracellular nuclease
MTSVSRLMRSCARYLVFSGMGVAGITQAYADIFISEYVEGSSYNKAIELYNGTGTSIDLSTYELQYYFNGSTSPGRTIPFTGILSDGQTYVVAEDAATPALRGSALLRRSLHRQTLKSHDCRVKRYQW